MYVIGDGLRGLITKIDKDADWAEFVRLCTERSGRIQKNDVIQQDNIMVRHLLNEIQFIKLKLYYRYFLIPVTTTPIEYLVYL